jgi:hypothetical protein
LSTDGRGSSNSSRKSSEASDIDSPWGEKVVFETHSEDCDLEAENQGQPLVIEKEPTYHRIQVCIKKSTTTLCNLLILRQRRRIQNRNAQRNFRQRQENERRMLEEQLKVAEQQCKKLSKTCNELNSTVNMMRDRLKRLEAENIVLRTSVYSMPWRKDST